MPRVLNWHKVGAFLQKSTSVFGASFLLLCASFAGIFPPLWEAWQKDEYSHGPLIPVIAFLIGWHRLGEQKPSAKAEAWGLLPLVAGFVLLAVSQVSAFEAIARYGFIVACVGMVWGIFGRSFVKVLLPSFVYLLFAVPLPSYIYVTLSAEMQLWSSSLGVWFLGLLGIVVYQEGNVIDLGAYKLQVVEACSGLRYLFPLLSFGFLIAFLFQARMWKRATIFLSVIPLTIIMNAARIAVVGVTVDRWGSAMAEGVLHDFEGWVVFGVCVLLLFAEARLLALVGKTGGIFRYDYIGLPREKMAFLQSASVSGARGWREGLIFLVTVFFALLMLAGSVSRKQEVIPQRTSLISFPLEIDAWRGVPKKLSEGELSLLQLTDYWLADYTNEKVKSSINLYIAYYASQRVGSSIHSPGNCLPGSGWDMQDRHVTPLEVGGQSFPVTRVVIRKGEDAMLVYYWFHGRGRISNEQYEAKWYLLVDSLRIHRTDGALVRLTTPVLREEKIEDADRRLTGFLAEIYPRLRFFVP